MCGVEIMRIERYRENYRNSKYTIVKDKEQKKIKERKARRIERETENRNAQRSERYSGTVQKKTSNWKRQKKEYKDTQNEKRQRMCRPR